jgi:hypothetical protein
MSSLSVSWQRIYNRNYRSLTLPISLYYSTCKVPPTTNSGSILKVKVKVEVTSRLAVYRQSVRLGVMSLEAQDQRFLSTERRYRALGEWWRKWDWRHVLQCTKSLSQTDRWLNLVVHLNGGTTFALCVTTNVAIHEELETPSGCTR